MAAKKTKAAKKDKSGKVEGVELAKLNRPYLLKAMSETDDVKVKDIFVRQAELKDGDLVAQVAKHWGGLPAGDLAECEACGGISPSSNDVCPFCGCDASGKMTDEARRLADVDAQVPSVAEQSTAIVPEPSAHLAEVVDDLKPSSELKTERDLDESVRKIKEAKSIGAASAWYLGHEILRCRTENLHLLRTEGGKPVYKSWEAFVHKELMMTPANALLLMDVAKKATVEQVKALGYTKMALILTVPESDQPKLIEEARAGASRKDLTEKVRKIKKEKKFSRPKREDALPSASPTGGKPTLNTGRKPKQDTITVAALPKRMTLKAYKCPKGRPFDPKELGRAKTIADEPTSEYVLPNGVVLRVTTTKSDSGEVQHIVSFRRPVEEE
jgi:hypothetical protein